MNSPRDLRTRAIMKGAGFGLASRAVSVACTLAQVPIAIAYLGLEGFGLWMTLTSLAGLLTLGDLGISLGAKTLLAQAFGRGDPQSQRALADEAFRQVVPLAVALAVIGIALAWLLDWHQILDIHSPELARALPWAMSGLALAAALALPTALGASLASAIQLTWVQHLSVAVGGLLTLLVVAVGAAVHASWLSIVLCALALPVAINATLWFSLRRHLGWRGQAGAGPSEKAHRSELWRLARWFSLPQAGSLLAVMGLPVAVAAAGGPAAAAAFNILQRIFGLVSQMHWMSLSALWPAYSEAHARKDYTWMRHAYGRSWWTTLGLFLPTMVVLALAMPWIVRFWVGEVPAALTFALTAASAAWFSLQLLGQPPALLLNGLGRLKGVALYGTAGHLLSVAGMFVGGRLAGAPGAIVGMAAGYVLVGLPGAFLESNSALRALPR